MFATERAKLMFGCYRRGDANDPDTYVAAVAMVLARYSAEVVKAVTDPYSGLPSRKSESGWTGMPDVADVKEACEAEAVRIDRMAKYAALPRYEPLRLARPRPGPGAFANVFVPETAAQYLGYVERAKKADPREWRRDDKRPGIWVSYAWVVGPAQGAKSFSTFTEAELRELYPQPQSAPPALEPEAVPFE